MYDIFNTYRYRSGIARHTGDTKMDIATIAELAGVTEATAHEWVGYDQWAEPEHAAWLASASNAEIADWIAAGIAGNE